VLFQRINRSDAERVFMVAQAVSGGTITAGYPVVWDISASVDGVRVTQAATATLSLLVGIAVDTILNSAYGRIQVYGLQTQANVTNDTSQAIAAGDILKAVNAQNYLTRSGASDGTTGFVYAAAAVATATTPAAAGVKVFLRAM
jgi:hypothetical protein